jgi:hypothetical protein
MSIALTDRQTREIETFCQIARENGAAITLRELIGLAAIDASERELEGAFLSDSKLHSRFLLESGYVFERPPMAEEAAQKIVEEENERRERASANLHGATRFGRSIMAGTVLVSVSGSNSYLSASENEDVDFFCITSTNGMWKFMLKALVLARIHRLANRDVPELCFSCVMDEKWAAQAFRTRQPPIFARDALTAKVISGTAAYDSLLKEASWMESYFPVFYRMRLREAELEEPRGTGPVSAVKGGSVVVNSLLYFIVGSFLRIKSWALNRRLTKEARHSSVFETKIGRGHYIYESNRYRNLSVIYEELAEETATRTLFNSK